jgi:hypothetical protein
VFPVPRTISLIRTRRRNETRIAKGISFFIVLFGIFTGKISAVTQRIKSTFTILLPTTFEIAICVFPSSADIKLTTNSGAEVPNATTVSQITSEEIPKLFAILPAHSIRRSAHFIRKINHNTRKMYSIFIII